MVKKPEINFSKIVPILLLYWNESEIKRKVIANLQWSQSESNDDQDYTIVHR